MPTRTPVPEQFQGGPKATEPQKNYIRGLACERDITDEDRERLLGKLDRDEILKSEASPIIDWLKKRDRATGVQPRGTSLPAVPPGRYAVDNAEGELRFYKVWQSKDGSRTKLYVLHGPYESDLPFPAIKAIMDKIAVDVRAAAIRYGNEIGACSNCGRRLTNRISRELAIGPICGGRMFGDDFKLEVKAARAAIVARGDDPDEELAPTERQLAMTGS